jgi:hypothetical protein
MIDKAELESARKDIEEAFQGNNPVVLNTTLPNTINNTTETLNFEPFNDVRYTPRPEVNEKYQGQPGIFEGIAHEYSNYSALGSHLRAYQKGQALKPDNDTFDNPSDDPIPDDWKPWQNRDLFRNVSQVYWDDLIKAKSPKDLQARYNYARDQMAKEEYYSRGSIIQKIVSKSIGIPGGIILDYPNLLPFAATMKYLKASQTFLTAAVKSIPTLAAIEVTKEGINYANDPDLTLADAGYHVARDTLAGMFLIGGMAGLGRGYEGYKLYSLRASQDFNRDGIGFKFNLGDKGEIKGYTAYAMPNESLNAAKVTRAQEYADSEFAKTGLFWFPKMLGTSPLLKAAKYLSPVVRGLNSTYGSVRSIVNRTADHDINTVGGNKHVPDSTSFEKRLMNIEGDANMFGAKMEGLRKEYNGIDLTVDEEEALKKLNSNLNKRDPADPASFGRRVASAVITDSNTEGLQINEAKRMWDEFAAKYWARYQRAMGFREETLPLATAKGYLTQVYNRVAMEADQSGWIEAVSQALKTQDELILSMRKPVDDLDRQIKQVRQEILDGINLEQNRTDLKDLRALRREARQKMIDEIRDNPEHNMLLRERNLLTSAETKGLKALLKPLNELKRQQTKINRQLSPLRKERQSLIRNLEAERKEGLSDEILLKQHAEIKGRLDEVDAKIAEIENEVESFKTQIMDEQSRLNGLALEGAIPDSYFYHHHESGHIVFRNPNEIPKFRSVYESHEERELDAKALYNSILNNSDEDVMNSQVKNLTGIIREDPTYKRTVMIPSTVFLNNNFLVTDMGSIAHNYAMGLGKVAAMNEALDGLGITKKGIDGAFELIEKEYQDKLRSLEGLEGKERVKKKEKLSKEYNQEKQYVQDLLDAMMGINHDRPGIRKTAADIRNLAASTKLGFVPLTQLSDLMGNTFKHGIYRFIRDGFAPTLATLNGKLKTKSAENFRRTASEANLALEHFRGNLVKKFYGYDSFGELQPRNRVSAFLQKAAHFSGNLSGMNYIENFNQAVAANIADSKIIELMSKYTKGTISKKESAELSRIGLDPERWAKPFMEQVELHGQKGVFGGYDSYFYNWTDKAASVKMSESIHVATRNTIIRKGKADAPFFVNNSVLSLVTQFMGWGFAAFNRYTIPLLQRGEANQIIGTMLMAMVASMEGVTRKLARGEEVDMDDENFMVEAFSNSAPLAMIYKTAMFANQFLDNDFLTSLQNDKQRSITQLGMIGGAGFGVLKDYARVISMIGSNDYNKQDIARLVRAIPGAQAWWAYQIQQKFIDAVTENLPDTRQK